MNTKLCFSFGNCDITFPYQLGIAKKLYDTFNDEIDNYQFAGSSHGVIAATLLSLKIDPGLFANYYFSKNYFKNPILSLITLFDDLDKQSIISEMNKRCNIIVTKLPFFEKVNINEFNNIHDLKKILEATCNFRKLDKLLPIIINSYLYTDGSISCTQPVYPDCTNITISVFYRSGYTITPSIPIHKFSLSNTIDEKDYYQLYELGIQDCLYWLKNNNLFKN
jgi:hypothetical protein